LARAFPARGADRGGGLELRGGGALTLLRGGGLDAGGGADRGADDLGGGE
jgi:hypothetical protein